MRLPTLTLLTLLLTNACPAQEPRQRSAANAPSKLWIIDPHTHFKGAAQIAHEAKAKKRNPKDTLGQIVEPKDYRPIADRLGIQATMVVEAVDQDQPQFNDWVLKQAKSDVICGYVARGKLGSPAFLKNYRRYRQSAYMKGYRFRFDELAGYLRDGQARAHLRQLEHDGMVVDLLMEPTQADDVAQLSHDFPRLKIVINHCFRVRMRQGEIPANWFPAIASCARYPNVYCKISSIVNFADVKPFGKAAPSDLAHYRKILETCYRAFGEDRVIFATNWAVCTHFGKVDDVVRIVTEFLQTKGSRAVQKGMRENAIRVYNIQPEHLRSNTTP